MSEPARTRRGDLVPLTDRIRHLRVFRLGAAAVVLIAWLAVPAVHDAVPLRPLASVTGSYVALSVLVELLWRFGGRRRLALLSALLIVDGVYLAWLVHVTGGQDSALRGLILVHVLAVALLASFRTGLKLAMWHSLLAVATFHLLEIGALDPASAPVQFGDETFRRLALDVAVLWAVAIATATFAAVNERELRRRRYDLEILARLSLRLETASEPGAVAEALLDAAGDDHDYARAAVLAADVGAPQLLAHRGATPSSGPLGDPAPGSVLERAASSGRPVLVSRLAPGPDGELAAILPDSRNLVVVPMHADGRTVGFLVVEHGARRGSRIERRAVAALERLASQAALALSNAWLLERLQRLASHDGLTGVRNRRALEDALAAELARSRRTGRPVSLLMLDIDHFKRLNDTHGHQVGDAALRAVASALTDEVRTCDVVGRYGGEEFAVVLPEIGPEDALLVAERLRARISALGDPVPVTASFGVAGHPTHGPDAASLIKAADDALYVAKRGGRDRAVAAPAPARAETA